MVCGFEFRSVLVLYGFTNLLKETIVHSVPNTLQIHLRSRLGLANRFDSHGQVQIRLGLAQIVACQWPVLFISGKPKVLKMIAGIFHCVGLIGQTLAKRWGVRTLARCRRWFLLSAGLRLEQ